MCSPTWETHTTPDMCFCSGMCVPYPVTIPSDVYSPSWVTHITRDMCSQLGETHFTRDVCFMGRGTHITSGMCFSGKGTHITSDICYPTQEHVSLVISVPLYDDMAILS